MRVPIVQYCSDSLFPAQIEVRGSSDHNHFAGRRLETYGHLESRLEINHDRNAEEAARHGLILVSRPGSGHDDDRCIHKQVVLMPSQESECRRTCSDDHINRETGIFCSQKVADQLVVSLIRIIRVARVVEEFGLVVQFKVRVRSERFTQLLVDLPVSWQPALIGIDHEYRLRLPNSVLCYRHSGNQDGQRPDQKQPSHHPTAPVTMMSKKSLTPSSQMTFGTQVTFTTQRGFR